MSGLLRDPLPSMVAAVVGPGRYVTAGLVGLAAGYLAGLAVRGAGRVYLGRAFARQVDRARPL